MDKSKAINPWLLKPWWCQPWSILLTGVSIIGGSWWLGHKIWLTLLVAGPISVWMGFFLLVWPKLMQAELLDGAKDEGWKGKNGML